MWARLVRWLAREQIAYLEYENRELRYDGARWRHRWEGAMDAVFVFQNRYDYMEKAVADTLMMAPRPPIIVSKETLEEIRSAAGREEHPNAESAGIAEGKWKD